MSDSIRPRGKFILPTPATCRHRGDVRKQAAGGEDAVCELLLEISGVEDRALARVGEDACRACCESFPPTRAAWNPVIASLTYDLARRVAEEGGAPGCTAPAALQLQREAEAALDVIHSPEERIIPARAVLPCRHLGDPIQPPSASAEDPERTCRHPAHRVTTLAKCRLCRDWGHTPLRSRRMTLKELTPPPGRRCGPPVRTWAVGVLTAPRREPTLEWCLDSLIRAGWSEPHVFIDGSVRLPEAHDRLSVTWREQRVGAWPNFYLALSELVLSNPRADAYFMVQDDAVFYDAENLRSFLEGVLWPGEKPSLTSLYCSQAYNLTEPGWRPLERNWVWGALAFIFPPDLAREFLNDPWVFRRRWEAPRNGLAGIDVAVGQWFASRGLPVWLPNPSLVQHVGNASSIWRDARNATLRRADWFAGDLEAPFAADASLADFP
ncbi:MAG: hypothetical protein KY475_16760, partial [Planctomycetes bacterium]|nr:hypothetical protein [Planctomycetota bacterium]